MNRIINLSKNNWLASREFFNLGLGLFVLFFIWIFNRLYITPLLLGFIIASLSYPLYHLLNTRLKPALKQSSQALTAILTILLVSYLLSYLLNLFSQGLIREYPTFQEGVSDFISNLHQNPLLINTFGLNPEHISQYTSELAYNVNEFLTKSLNSNEVLNQVFSPDNISLTLTISQRTLQQVFDLLVYSVVFILAWYYGLVFGKRWLESIFKIIPFSPREKRMLEKDLENGIRNVVYANLISGIIHALVVFLIMVIFGLPSKFIITTIVFLIGVLPLSPSELAYSIPIFLVFQNNPLAAIILIPIAEVIILWVNYFLVPKIISDEGEGNPLLILTSILSGVGIFGLMGFIIAPVIMVLIQTLYKILMERLGLQKSIESQN